MNMTTTTTRPMPRHRAPRPPSMADALLAAFLVIALAVMAVLVGGLLGLADRHGSVAARGMSTTPIGNTDHEHRSPHERNHPWPPSARPSPAT